MIWNDAVVDEAWCRWLGPRGEWGFYATSIMALKLIDHECDEGSVARPALEQAAPPRP